VEGGKNIVTHQLRDKRTPFQEGYDLAGSDLRVDHMSTRAKLSH
jgi:hypothetical protein